MENQKFCLKWDGFQRSVTSTFDDLRQDGELTDITLCCEGQRVMAHRMMLSACSPYFRELLKNNQCQQMVIFLRDTSAADLNAIIEFMYKGSVNVSQTQLGSFIKTAEMLQIKGLSGDDEKGAAPPPSRRSPDPPPVPPPTSPPAKRRRRGSELSEPPPRPPAPAERPATPLAADPLPPPVKVEKIDLTDEEGAEGDLGLDATLGAEGDAGLDATLGYVAEYEGVGLEPGPAAGPGQPDLTAAALGGLAGPSQRLAEDGSAQGFPDNSLQLSPEPNSSKGLSQRPPVFCQICGKQSSNAFSTRRHMQLVHKLSKAAVLNLVPFTRKW